MKQISNFKVPYLFLLATAAAVVSFIGATFSVTGLAKLFSGASSAVMFMAAALEFAKIVSAGFLHQNWKKLGFGLKIYLSLAVGALMTITSLGIFGYLSHAYQKSAVALNNAQIKLSALQKEDTRIQEELARVQKQIDDIPRTRVSKRLELEKEIEPEVQRLKKRSFEVDSTIQQTMVEKQSYQTEIGPLVYVAEAFNMRMDQVARWFILLFVCVFDPLAVCLVFATSWSMKNGQEERENAEKAAAEKALAKAKEVPVLAQTDVKMETPDVATPSSEAASASAPTEESLKGAS